MAEQLPRESSSGSIADSSVIPVLHVDFNDPREPLLARRGVWFLPSGQRVSLDDHEGTNCKGNVIGRPTWDKQNRYVLVQIDHDTFEHYGLPSPLEPKDDNAV